LLICTLRHNASCEWHEVENPYVPRNVTYHHEDHAVGLLRHTTIRLVRLPPYYVSIIGCNAVSVKTVFPRVCNIQIACVWPSHVGCRVYLLYYFC